MDWLNLGVFIFYFISLSILTIALVREFMRSAKREVKLNQALADKLMLYKELDKIKEKGGVAESDTFIQYLSSSRESAYEYIGEVQEKIHELIVAWNHHTTEMPPDGSSEKKLYDAYAALVAMLPKDTGND